MVMTTLHKPTRVVMEAAVHKPVHKPTRVVMEVATALPLSLYQVTSDATVLPLSRYQLMMIMVEVAVVSLLRADVAA